jgi:hypothetical protein
LLKLAAAQRRPHCRSRRWLSENAAPTIGALDALAAQTGEPKLADRQYSDDSRGVMSRVGALADWRRGRDVQIEPY